MKQGVASRLLLCASITLLIGAQAQAETDPQIQIYQYFLKLAESGDPAAQFIVSERLMAGKGVDKNAGEANRWLAKAAENGHPLAQERLKPSPSVEAQSLKPEASAEPAPVPVAAKPAPKPPKPVASAPAAKPVGSTKPTIDVAAMLLSGKWQRSGQAADAIPSDSTTCLRTSEKEITCFSDAMKRTVGGKTLTYIAKSTITNFQPEGKFVAQYVYNVTDIASGSGAITDDGVDLVATPGWQEPGHTLECRAIGQNAINCVCDNKHEVRFLR